MTIRSSVGLPHLSQFGGAFPCGAFSGGSDTATPLALSGNQAEDESSLFSKSATAKFKIGHSGLKPASTRCRRHLYVKPGGCPWPAHVAPSPPRAMSSNARPDYAGALARTRGTNNGRGSRCELGKGPRAIGDATPLFGRSDGGRLPARRDGKTDGAFPVDPRHACGYCGRNHRSAPASAAKGVQGIFRPSLWR